MADDKVLIVDDDQEILKAFTRLFAKKLAIETATSGEAGLEVMAQKGPFAAVVSDYRMPGMDGVSFLSRVKEVSPETVRLLLTGYADLKTAIEAVNVGKIFRLLTKPCPPAVLAEALVEAIKQYRLIIAERELLEKTLQGCVKVLTDLLALAKPEAFGRSSRIAALTSKIAQTMGLENQWEITVASSLSQIGLIAFPEPLIKRISKGRKLSPQEMDLFKTHPKLAADLVSAIPRLERVAEIIAYQEKKYDGSGLPEDPLKGEEIPLGARILKVAIDFDALTFSGLAKGEALMEMKRQPEVYDPQVLAALTVVLGEEAKYAIRPLKISELKENMILSEDIYSISPKHKLLARGHSLSQSMIELLKQYRQTIGVKEPIVVMEPLLIK